MLSGFNIKLVLNHVTLVKLSEITPICVVIVTMLYCGLVRPNRPKKLTQMGQEVEVRDKPITWMFQGFGVNVLQFFLHFGTVFKN